MYECGKADGSKGILQLPPALLKLLSMLFVPGQGNKRLA
jgi:hypothetical protein